MQVFKAIAENFKQLYSGGNWTASALKAQLEDVDWKMATTAVGGCNTIATLVFHINYYVKGVSDYLNGRELEIRDKFSFDCPEIKDEPTWQALLTQTYQEMASFQQQVSELDDKLLAEVFVDEKYGSYYRNFQGIVEHGYYHLGQIVVLKKIIAAQRSAKS